MFRNDIAPDTNKPIHEEHPEHPPRIKIIVFLALAFAAYGWLNSLAFSISECHVLLSYYTENFIILGFGMWRVWLKRIRIPKNDWLF